VGQGTITSQPGAAEQFDAAYKSLRADPAVQFNLVPPAPQQKPPAWLEAFFKWLADVFEPVGKFLAKIASYFPDAAYARILLWAVLGIAAIIVAWALYNRLRHGRWSLRLPRRAVPADMPEDDWVPTEQSTRAWLEEADALAAAGRYAEAVHHLLFRSIDDIASRRPNLVRPALTSREIAAARGIPARAGQLFAGITALVERSLFGGRAVAEGDWLQAREAYANFALAGSWRS